MEELAAAQKRAIQTVKELTAAGKQVRYIRSTFVPGEDRCICLFDAPDPEDVREANERAQIPSRESFWYMIGSRRNSVPRTI